MPDTPSITIVKRFTYRGQPEEFSNRYHFSGTTPATDAAWKALADAIILNEKVTVPATISFVKAYGYEAGNKYSIYGVDYTAAPLTPVVGTFATGSALMPGDNAATMRWRTPERNERGKWIYCRKYFHGVYAQSSSSPDILLTAQKTAWETFGAKLIDGTLPGSFKYCGPQGAVLGPPECSGWVTTRTLKRRGKRPPLATGP